MVQPTAKMLLILLAASIFAVSQVNGECNPNNLQCIGRNMFQQCQASSFAPIFPCNVGEVCSPVDPVNRICIPEPPLCSETGPFRFPGTCNSYYICINNGLQWTQLIGYCAPPFEFNIRLQRCVNPPESGCGAPEPMTTTTTPITTTTPPITTTTTLPTVTSTGISNPITITPTTTPLPPISTTTAIPFECPGLGLYPDVTNCRQYYRCTRRHLSRDLVFLRYTCPVILPHFDTVRRTCWYFNERCVPQCPVQ